MGTITIKVRRELHAKIRGLAALKGQTVSQFIRERLAKHVGLPAKSAAAPRKGEEGAA
jgi:hypothetical protein